MNNLHFPKLTFSSEVQVLVEESTRDYDRMSSSSKGSSRSIKDILTKKKELTDWMLTERALFLRNTTSLRQAGSPISSIQYHDKVAPGLNKVSVSHFEECTLVGKINKKGHVEGRMGMVSKELNILLGKMKNTELSGTVRIYLNNGTKITCSQKSSSSSLNGKATIKTQKGITLVGIFQEGVFYAAPKQSLAAQLALSLPSTLKRYEAVKLSDTEDEEASTSIQPAQQQQKVKRRAPQTQPQAQAPAPQQPQPAPRTRLPQQPAPQPQPQPQPQAAPRTRLPQSTASAGAIPKRKQ